MKNQIGLFIKSFIFIQFCLILALVGCESKYVEKKPDLKELSEGIAEKVEIKSNGFSESKHYKNLQNQIRKYKYMNRLISKLLGSSTKVATFVDLVEQNLKKSDIEMSEKEEYITQTQAKLTLTPEAEFGECANVDTFTTYNKTKTTFTYTVAMQGCFSESAPITIAVFEDSESGAKLTFPAGVFGFAINPQDSLQAKLQNKGRAEAQKILAKIGPNQSCYSTVTNSDFDLKCDQIAYSLPQNGRALVTAKASRSLGWEFHIDYFEDEKRMYSSTFLVDTNGSIHQRIDPVEDKTDFKKDQREEVKTES